MYHPNNEIVFEDLFNTVIEYYIDESDEWFEDLCINLLYDDNEAE